MMKISKRNTFLYLASFFTLFPFVGHTTWLFLPIPREQLDRLAVFSLMHRPVVMMPMNILRSYADILNGTNIVLSIYLLMTGLYLLALKNVPLQQSKSLIFITAAATLLHAVTTHAVDIVLAGLLLIGSVMGAQYGARLSHRVPHHWLKLLLACLLFLVASRLAYGLFITPPHIFTLDITLL
jgi:uncharacterized membrane protein YfcA